MKGTLILTKTMEKKTGIIIVGSVLLLVVAMAFAFSVDDEPEMNDYETYTPIVVESNVSSDIGNQTISNENIADSLVNIISIIIPITIVLSFFIPAISAIRRKL